MKNTKVCLVEWRNTTSLKQASRFIQQRSKRAVMKKYFSMLTELHK